ncbi:MAG: enoyl-CoA hydratase/isomerase family protein [Alphaproteobacteria bacterium]|nr:enoyl-CoA hydratase/isomerase family protein [Alphaproteobacteria bacterium]
MQLSTDKILASREHGIGTVIFNNPVKRNALSLEMWTGIGEALAAFEGDPEVRVVVLRGAGGKAFISGADISQFEERRSNAKEAADYSAITDHAWHALANCSRPVIAAIEGFCIGGGLAVALKADLRIATDESVFGIPAAKLGIAYPTESIRDLVNLVGPSEAKAILFTGAQLDAVTAHRIGLVNRVVASDMLDKAVKEVAGTMIENAPLSILASKVTVDQLARGEFDKELLASLSNACFESKDFAEGRRAFMDKRKPRFTGS